MVDTSGLVDVAAVAAAVERIDLARVGFGAAVVVRIWDEVPGDDLAAEVDRLIDECFGGADGEIDAAVAIVALATDERSSDVLLGGDWVLAVDADRLRSEVMAPHLIEDDVTAALVAGLDEMASSVAALRLSVDAEPVEDDGGETDPGAAEGALVDEGAAPEEEGSSGEVLRGEGPSSLEVGLRALGAGACGAAMALVHRRRRLAAGRIRLTHAVGLLQGRLRVVKDRHRRLIEAADSWYGTSVGRSRTVVGAERSELETAAEATDRAAAQLHKAMASQGGGADRPTLERGRELVGELSVAIDAHGQALDRMAAVGAHLAHLRVALPTRAELLAREVPDLRELTNRRAAQGSNVEQIRDDLSLIQATIDEVCDAGSIPEVDLLALSDELDEAETRLFVVGHLIAGLGEQCPALLRWHERLGQAVDNEMIRIDDLRRQLAAVTRAHAPGSYRWAVNQVEQGVELLDRVDDRRFDVAEELVPGQALDEAREALEQASTDVRVAGDLLDEVDDFLVDVERALAEAPRAVADGRSALDELTAIVTRYELDAGPEVTRRRDELGAVAAALGHELGHRKPDHLRVAEAAEELADELDRLIGEAEEGDAADAVRRRQLGREVARATRALARARRSAGPSSPVDDGAAIERLEAELGSLPDEPRAAIDAAAGIVAAALRVQEQLIARRRRRHLAISTDSEPPMAGLAMGEAVSARGTAVAARTRGGRSLRLRREAS